MVASDDKASSWTRNEVSEWLNTIGLPTLTDDFMVNGINGADLLTLSDEDFELLGARPLQARKLRTEINKLASKAPVATYPMTFESPVWSNPTQPAAAPPPAIDTTYSMTFDHPVRAIHTKAASTRSATSQPVAAPKQEDESSEGGTVLPVVEEVRAPVYTDSSSDDTQEWLAIAHAALMGLVIVFSIATFANIVAYVQDVCVDDYYYYYFALDDGECETYWTYMEYLATWLSVLTAVYLLWSSASASSRAWLAGCMFVIILTQSIKASTYYNTNAMAGINSNLDANIALLWVLFSLWGATLVVNVYREE